MTPPIQKVAILGPVQPFRSGIAKHTTALACSLVEDQGVLVKAFSFSRQYPKALFPGENDKDLNVGPEDNFTNDFCLDSINPFTWLTTALRIKRFKPDVVIIPSWTFFLAPCLGIIALILKAFSIPSLIVVHNVLDHEESYLKALASKFLLKRGDAFITHGEALAADTREIVGEKTIVVTPHPIYDHYPEPTKQAGSEGVFSILFFGLIRSYKGLDIALKALSGTSDENIRMMIAGEFWEGKEETLGLIDSLGLENKVSLVDRYVSDQEAADLFAEADVVVLPYRAATGSGVIALAYHYGKPVIVSDLQPFKEVVWEDETGWIFPQGDTEALAEILRTLPRQIDHEKVKVAIQEKKPLFSWSTYSNKLLDMAHQVREKQDG